MLSFFSCRSSIQLLHEILCGMSIASVKQPLMKGVTAVHRISCTAIEPRHGRGGTAQQRSCMLVMLLLHEFGESLS
jgi:hypothetical protein